MQVLETCPILRIFDEAKARVFYLEYLGFEVEFEHRFEPSLPLYMSVRRGGLTLHLSEHHGDASPGATVFVRITGLSAFHAELLANPKGKQRPSICRQDWGLEFEIVDPFMNRIRFCEA
jgi:hypothetical protein